MTGAASGIGRAIANRLASCGANVAVVDKDGAAARETAAALPGQCAVFEVDLTDREATQLLGAAVEDELGPVSIVVNAAGWDLIEPFLRNSRDYWDRVVALNFMAPVEVTRVFLDRMVERGGPGRIVNIASDAGRVGSSGEVVYAGTKGAVIAFTKALAREVAASGVTANCVCPGPTDTALLGQLADANQRLYDGLARAIPMRRIAQPDDIAPAVCFLASD